MNRKETENYFFNRVQKHLDNGFNFDEHTFDSIINELERYNEEYAPITWEELKDMLIYFEWNYCECEDSIVTDEYAKKIGLIDEDDDLHDE